MRESIVAAARQQLGVTGAIVQPRWCECCNPPEKLERWDVLDTASSRHWAVEMQGQEIVFRELKGDQ